MVCKSQFYSILAGSLALAALMIPEWVRLDQYTSIGLLQNCKKEGCEWYDKNAPFIDYPRYVLGSAVLICFISASTCRTSLMIHRTSKILAPIMMMSVLTSTSKFRVSKTASYASSFYLCILATVAASMALAT